MSVRFLCTACGTSIKAKDEYSGKAARCPHCRARIQVPSDDQPNDVLEISDDYGLAAMSVGEIEIDSPEMHLDRPQAKFTAAPAVPLQGTIPNNAVDSPNAAFAPPPALTDQRDFRLLLRVSNGLLVLALFGSLVWLYVLGGQFIEFCFGGNPEEPKTTAYGSPLLQLTVTFIVGGTIICALAGASEACKLLLEIRNLLARRGAR